MKPRKLRKSSKKYIYGFNSIKSGKHFRVESGNEFGACYHLEYLNSVAAFEAQPLGYQYQEYRRKAQYTPDFKLTDKHNNDSFLEIKPADKASTYKFQDTFECKQKAAEAMGVPLTLLKDSDIKREPLLRNLRLLHKYRTDSKLTIQHCKILEIFNSYQKLSIFDVSEVLSIDKKVCYPLIYDLLARGALTPVCSLDDTPLTSNSLIQKTP